MALYEPTRSLAHGGPQGSRLYRAAIRAASALISWNDTRITRNALTKLSDQQLDDIGLCRGEIDRLFGR